MTAFTFDIDLADLPGMEQIEVPSIVNDDLFMGHMELTIDDTGLVRHWQFALDETLMRQVISAGAQTVPLAFGGDITSVDQPVAIELPTDFVDEPGASIDVPVGGPAPDDVCQVEQKTLQVATQAWLAATGSTIAPTEAQLVTDGYLRQEIPGYDIVDGAIVAAAGGRCA